MKLDRQNAFDKVKTLDDLISAMQIFATNVGEIVNSGIRFNQNFRCQIIEVDFTDANTDTTFSHSLNSVPTGYLALTKSAAMIIYNGSSTNFFAKTTCTLRSSAIGTANIMIF